MRKFVHNARRSINARRYSVRDFRQNLNCKRLILWFLQNLDCTGSRMIPRIHCKMKISRAILSVKKKNILHCSRFLLYEFVTTGIYRNEFNFNIATWIIMNIGSFMSHSKLKCSMRNDIYINVYILVYK